MNFRHLVREQSGDVEYPGITPYQHNMVDSADVRGIAVVYLLRNNVTEMWMFDKRHCGEESIRQYYKVFGPHKIHFYYRENNEQAQPGTQAAAEAGSCEEKS